MRESRLWRVSTVIVLCVFLAMSGCATYSAKINGVPLDEPLYASAGASDAGVAATSSWYNTVLGKIGLVLFGGLAGWFVYEVVDDDDPPPPPEPAAPPPPPPPT